MIEATRIYRIADSDAFLKTDATLKDKKISHDLSRMIVRFNLICSISTSEDRRQVQVPTAEVLTEDAFGTALSRSAGSGYSSCSAYASEPSFASTSPRNPLHFERFEGGRV